MYTSFQPVYLPPPGPLLTPELLQARVVNSSLVKAGEPMNLWIPQLTPLLCWVCLVDVVRSSEHIGANGTRLGEAVMSCSHFSSQTSTHLVGRPSATLGTLQQTIQPGMDGE